MANAIKSENSQDITTLISMANRLEDAIHRRRLAIAAAAPAAKADSAAGGRVPADFPLAQISGPD